MGMGMTVGDMLRVNARYYPEEVAAIDGGRSRTWAELHRRTDDLAGGLLRLGLQKGDRLAVLSPNSLFFWELFFGLAKSGIIGVPLNIRLHPHELASYLNYTGPKAIVIDQSMRDLAREILPRVPSVQHLIGLPGVQDLPIEYEQLISGGGELTVEVDENDTYMFGPTSGTTGVPKAAVLTHRNCIAAIQAWLSEGMDVRPGDAALQTIPMFFNPGGPASMFQFMKAGKGVILPNFTPELFLKAVQEHRITHTILVPTMLTMVVNHPEVEKYDVSSIRALIMGGSPLPASLLRRGREIFGDVFFPQYGMAESYSCGLLLKRQDQFSEGPLADRLRSAGKPHATIQARVVDDGGGDVAWGSGEAGEIIMRGPSLCEGYYKMPEETRFAFRDGWLHTGDMGTIDKDGFIYVVDRKKDMIITGGINVFSVEVENTIAAHPAVQMVAVIGVPDSQWGEAIKACVVLKAGHTATEQDIINLCRERLASYKKPKYVEFRKELPISGTGKVLKRVLREEHGQREPAE